MFCHGCLRRYLRGCLILFMLVKAFVTAYVAGDILTAFRYARLFQAMWYHLAFVQARNLV